MNEILNILEELNYEIDFSKDTALIDNGILDSFDIISIIASIYDVFGITVPPQEIIPENFNSAAALYAMVTRLLYDRMGMDRVRPATNGEPRTPRL